MSYGGRIWLKNGRDSIDAGREIHIEREWDAGLEAREEGWDSVPKIQLEFVL